MNWLFRREIVKEGMVKVSDADDKSISFAPGVLCRKWIQIPIDLIDHVEFVRMVRCHDHEHPFVRLHLQEPAQANTVAAVLADLLRSSPEPRMEVQPKHRRARSRAQASNCHWTGYYKCEQDDDDAPWQDAYGNGASCGDAKAQAQEAYNNLCTSAGYGLAILKSEDDDCYCD